MTKMLNGHLKKSTNFFYYFSKVPLRYFKRTVIAQITISFIVMFLVAFMTRFYFKSYGVNQAKEQLNESLSLIKQSIQGQSISPVDWCQSLRLNWKTRYSLLTSDGVVLCDSHLPTKHLPSQIDAVDIKAALEKGIGFHFGKGSAQENDALYGALTIKAKYHGELESLIIRQVVELSSLHKAMRDLDKAILAFLFPFMIFSSLFSIWIYLRGSSPLLDILKKVELMRKTAQQEPIVEIDDDDEEGEYTPEIVHSEWTTVEQTLNRVQLNLEKYIDEIYNENQKLNTVMRSISDSILAIGLNENILFANRQFKKNFIGKEFRDKDLTQYKVWEVSRDMILHEQFKECLNTKEYFKKRKIHLPVKGGKRYRYFDIRVNPLIDNRGEIFGAAGVLQDVSDQLLAEQMREDFVANVSHEVRTPLTALKGYVQILKDTLSDQEESSNYLNKIEQNSNRLTHLFSDILNLSVIESKQVVEKSSVLVKEITSNVINNVKQGYLNKDIQVKVDYQIEKIWANPQLLEQVLTNLVENAFKYSQNNGHISISWISEEDGRYDILKVQDKGPGIPKEHLPRLFERFYRVDHGRSRDMGGTGLGLAIVKHIVQIHNGKVDVSSSLEKGSLFTIKFPAHYQSKNYNNPV